MKRTKTLVLAAVLLGTVAMADSAGAFERQLTGRRYAQTQPWHDGYSHPGWGTPVALVVPPTAENQVHYGWGVGATRVTKIYPQFQLGYPGPTHYDVRAFQATPRWPSSTDQLGVYYIRGPW
jgi:hypothetical protein